MNRSPSKRNILFLPNLFHPDRWNGIMEHLRILIQGLDPDRYKIFVAVRPDDGDQTERLIALTGATRCDLGLIRSVQEIRTLCLSERIDIVHIQTPVTGGVPRLALGARLARVRRIIVSYQLAQSQTLPLKSRLVNRLVHSVLVDQTVAVSNGVAASLIYNAGVIGAPILTVYNAVDIIQAGHVPELQSLRAKDHVWVGYFGRLAEEKGVRFLIEAFSSVVCNASQARLLLVGDGYLREDLTEQVTRLGLDDKVKFLGHRDDARAIMQDVDIVVLPSLVEGFSLVLVEAMAASRPVVATDIPGTREAIVQGENGLTVLPGDAPALADAILALVRNFAARQSMGESGRRRFLQRFESRVMVTQIEELYTSSS